MAEPGQVRVLGVMRPRTLLYRDFQKALKLTGGQRRESGRLLAGLPLSDNSPGDNISPSAPPAWLEAYKTISSLLKSIEQDLQRLKQTQQQRLQMAFGDVKTKDREIATVSESITTV